MALQTPGLQAFARGSDGALRHWGYNSCGWVAMDASLGGNITN
jgi:hypothetical protein